MKTTAAAGALAASWPSISAAADAAPAERPNILFIMTDEQHHRSLSITGNRYITTPNMDRLAREGALFERATCVTPYCSPSRASMITGVYPHRHKILQNVSPGKGAQAPLAPDAFPNTECLLHAAGYATAHRGKWHLGKTGDFPCYENLGYTGDAEAYNKLLEEHAPQAKFAGNKNPGKFLKRPVEMIPAIREAYDKFRAMPNNGVSYIATIGRTDIPPEALPETHITTQVLDLIEKNKDRAFMITCSWSPPHDLWVTPEPYYSMVPRDKIELTGSRAMQPWDQKAGTKVLGDLAGEEGLREFAAIYHGMVKYIDDQLGRILEKLDQLGLTEKTLILFTSDHGDMAGAHGCIGKSIASAPDDLLRVPLILRWPGKIKPGTVVRELVSHVDFMPTLLDYVGMPAPQNIHGRSMRSLIEGTATDWRDYAFCQRADKLRLIRTMTHKYGRSLKGDIEFLYDLEQDPHEDRNLAGDPAQAELLKSMRQRLLDVMRADGDPQAEAYAKPPSA